ncbi:MAG: hypothetical protein ACXWJ6_15380 [Xanthobacteraceae bacterium]
MPQDQVPIRGPEQPRVEPEIIPPGEDARARTDAQRVWMQFETGSGVHRVFIARPGLPSIILTVLIFGVIVAVILLVLAGIVFLWIPILIGGILLAVASGTIRYRWRQLQAWWQRRS